jgi:hypothetical protein
MLSIKSGVILSKKTTAVRLAEKGWGTAALFSRLQAGEPLCFLGCTDGDKDLQAMLQHSYDDKTSAAGNGILC